MHLITFAEYSVWKPGTSLSEEEFARLLNPVCQTVDAMLFHAVSKGSVSESDMPYIKAACFMQMAYAEKIGAGAYLALDSREIGSESGTIGGISDSVTYVQSESFQSFGDHRASKEAYAYLSSLGIVARLRRVRL